MNPTNKLAYIRHMYSGPRKSRKKVQATLKRHHGNSSKDFYPNTTQDNHQLSNPSTAQYTPKTYSRRIPQIRYEAKACSSSSNTVESVTEQVETVDFDWPQPDPQTEAYQLTVERTSSDNLSGLVCRVCLAMDVKMYDLKNIELREMFQNITRITVTQNNHSILERLCWECAGRLKAAAAFRHKALLSDALLQGLASTGEQIRKNDITLIKENKDYLKSTRTLSVVEVLHTVDIDPENDSITPLSENNDAEIVQNTVRKDSFELKQETIIDEENDQTDVKDESMIEAPIKTEMEYDQFDHICPPNTGEESSNAFIETNPLVSNYVNLEDDKINSADSSPLAGCSHVEPRYPIFGYLKKKPIDCEDKITKHVIITTSSISKIVSKDLKELISAKSKNINVKIGGVSKKTSNKKLVKKN